MIEMGSGQEVVEIANLERSLLPEREIEEAEGDTILYTASFEAKEENFVEYLKMSPSKSVRHDASPYSGDLVLPQKLEEVESSVKRVQTLTDEQQCQTLEYVN